MTNSKVRNSDSAYSICFSEVLLKLFTFLINTEDKEIYNIFNSFLFPYYFNTNRTNKHTNINRVLIIKIKLDWRVFVCLSGLYYLVIGE